MDLRDLEVNLERAKRLTVMQQERERPRKDNSWRGDQEKFYK